MLRTAFILLALASAPAMAEDAPFTVSGVKVDITADNAADAREKAFAQAQENAFRQLAGRLLPEEEMTTFKAPESSAISTMVNDFEITQEQISTVQYIGTYTFRFNKDSVLTFLGASGASYSDVASRPVLILPYYQWGSRNLLWGSDNAWLAAWARSESAGGLVPVTIPIGDVMDVADMGDADALTYNPANLARMLGRYDAGEAVIVIASPVWAADQPETQIPAALDIMIYRTDSDRPVLQQELKTTTNPEDSAAVLFDRAVQETQKALQGDWKSRTQVTSSEGNNSLNVRVRFATMKEWIETQKALRAVQGILAVNLMSLKPGQANIELSFQGTEEKLRLALGQSDMALSPPQTEFVPFAHGGAPAGSPPPVYDLYLNKFKP